MLSAGIISESVAERLQSILGSTVLSTGLAENSKESLDFLRTVAIEINNNAETYAKLKAKISEDIEEVCMIYIFLIIK